MDSVFEELLAEQAAQSVAITTLLRALLKTIGAENGSEIRGAILSKWDEEGSALLDKTVIQGLSDDERTAIIEKAKHRLTDIFTTAHT